MQDRISNYSQVRINIYPCQEGNAAHVTVTGLRVRKGVPYAEAILPTTWNLPLTDVDLEAVVTDTLAVLHLLN